VSSTSVRQPEKVCTRIFLVRPANARHVFSTCKSTWDIWENADSKQQNSHATFSHNTTQHSTTSCGSGFGHRYAQNPSQLFDINNLNGTIPPEIGLLSSLGKFVVEWWKNDFVFRSRAKLCCNIPSHDWSHVVSLFCQQIHRVIVA
jgi:hypothetical protein